MPTFQKLTEEEVKARSARGSNEEALRPYVDALRGFAKGEWIVVKLGADEVQRTEKRRLSIAASSLGMKLKWKRTKGEGEIVFEITDTKAPEGAPAAAIGPDGKPIPNADKTIGAGSPPGRN